MDFINSDNYLDRDINSYLKEREERKQYEETHCILCNKETSFEELEKNEGLCDLCKKDFDDTVDMYKNKKGGN